MGFTLAEGRYGCDELCTAKVLSIKTKIDSIVKITLSSGREVRCTKNHKWLTRKYLSSSWDYGVAKEKQYLAHVIDPTPIVPTELERLAGWLGGIYDGEGSGRQLAQSETHNQNLYAKIGEAAEILGLNFSACKNCYYIRGGRQGYVNFLNTAKPHRRESILKLIRTRLLKNKPDKIVKIENHKEGEVVCLETTSGNYIVWGYASKNSAHHAESVENLLAWPWLRFEEMFDAHAKRLAVERVIELKNAMVSGVWANSNYDDGENTRANLLARIDDFSESAIAGIYGQSSEEEYKDDMESPFFKAMKVPKIDPNVKHEALGELP